ncbi:related to integral membrane protein [Fusarium fujikuroi]|nr:related to integral membrane protein [Fusarium fujikuroi]SCV51352.1 related to integral membrane protein [Fusarium fujikuroi]
MATLDPGVNIYNTSVVLPPIGQESNFDRPLSDVQLATITVFAVTYFLATVSLALRYATSAQVVKEWELDVVLITLAWGAALGYFISVCFMMKYGRARMLYLSPTPLAYMWSPTLTKLSILSILYRISPARGYQISVYVIAIALLVYTITFTVLLSGPCNPKDVGSGVCLNNLAISQVVLNIATDLSIIILPLPTLHNLQIPFRQKVVVGCILSIGSAVLIASIVRAPYVHIMATNPDFTRKQAEAGVWSLVELNMGISIDFSWSHSQV